MPLADLTPIMQHTLIRATTQGIRPQDVGTQDQHTVHPATLKALCGRELIHLTTNRKGRALWRPTDVGRGLVAEHVPLFLHRRPHRNYTHEFRFAVWAEPEVIDAA